MKNSFILADPSSSLELDRLSFKVSVVSET